ncbi:hypothetical protein B0F90DRAFT_1671639 [Multifurca ochricompacta]|uniref:Uncharacterized protein n=1 Tax=Multifurca ochricompacta TaxID=376703 RepID=A0AAD4QJ76_9AGAM|nr:hypothetical protein B0F90DRAFT_1671639 [Multifurca ochricompacta]
MPITTRKANAKAHPGHIIVNSQQKRRTSRQVAEDKAKSKGEEATAREMEATQHRAVVNRIANIEDRIQLAEFSAQKHAARPDLAPSAEYYPLQMAHSIRMAVTADNPSLCNVIEEVEHGQEEVHSQEDGPSNLESESELQDSGSEDSSARAQSYPPTVSPASFTDTEPVPNINAGRDQTDHADNDDNNNEFISICFSDLEEEEEEEEPRQRRRKGKGKQSARMESCRTKKKSSSAGQLRSEVAKARVVNSTVMGSIDERKRKELQESYHGQRDPKRSKIYSTGLHVNWERRSETQVPTSTGMKSAIMASGSNYASTGVSGIHEDNDTSQASQSLIDVQMGIMLTNVAVGTEDNLQDANPKRPRRRYLVTDLPFPHGSAHRRAWRKTFVPTLIMWAGSIEDPFGANNRVEGIIKDIWCLVYPDIPLGPKEMQITLGVIDNVLNNWRSDIGKAGYKVILDLWDNDACYDFASSEEFAKFAGSALEGFHFIYQYPDFKGSRAAFCSELITKVYAKHLQRIEKSPINYGPQIGALALVTAAVERGLTLFRDGVKGPGFIEDPWGRKV